MVKESDSYVEVPILRNFNSEDIIGTMKVLKEALPETPDYVFSIGYRILDCEALPDGARLVKKCDLISTSLMGDTQYKEYLKSVGKE